MDGDTSILEEVGRILTAGTEGEERRIVGILIELLSDTHVEFAALDLIFCNHLYDLAMVFGREDLARDLSVNIAHGIAQELVVEVICRLKQISDVAYLPGLLVRWREDPFWSRGRPDVCELVVSNPPACA